jgi:hypothetical protein
MKMEYECKFEYICISENKLNFIIKILLDNIGSKKNSKNYGPLKHFIFAIDS